VLTADQARQLLDSIDTNSMAGFRTRALIGVMFYAFARVGAVVTMKVEDYSQNGKRWWFRLHEKGGKWHEVPAHRKAEAYMDAYLDAGGLWKDKKGPLFRSVDRYRELTERPMHRNDVLGMIKRRAGEAGIPESTCCPTFRATGITAYLENGGTIKHAQTIAARESPRTTKLYGPYRWWDHAGCGGEDRDLSPTPSRGLKGDLRHYRWPQHHAFPDGKSARL